MLKVGVTGGIGSGKSTVCRVFQVLGVPVYYADVRARELSGKHPDIIAGYKTILGEEAYSADGSLNRTFVAAKIFSDERLLKRVNQMVHPVVQHDFISWTKQFDAPFVIEEAAVLFENGGYHHLDKIILITAPLHIRIQRVVNRDGVTPAMVKRRMERQWSDAQKVPLSDYVIHNDDHVLIMPQVLEVYEAIMQKI